jgi:hypothetical protein
VLAERSQPDNSSSIIPTRDEYYACFYLLKLGETPKYPQRPVLIAVILSQGVSGGATHTSNMTDKVIALNNLLDYNTFSWHGNRYKIEEKKSLSDRFGDNYRLYCGDNVDY